MLRKRDEREIGDHEGRGSITASSRCLSRWRSSGLGVGSTRPVFTAPSIQDASSWSADRIAVDNICRALPAVTGNLGLLGFGFLGIRFDLGLGLDRRLGQNSMVMAWILQ